MSSDTPPLPWHGNGAEAIPEYFAKPGVIEGLKVHPVLLIRQMATEIQRLQAQPSETAPTEAKGAYLHELSGREQVSAIDTSEFSSKLVTALADKFGVARPTLRGWLSGEVVPEPAFQDFVLKAIRK